MTDLSSQEEIFKGVEKSENLFDCDDHHHALYYIGRLFDEPNGGHVRKNHFGRCRCPLSNFHYSFNGSSKKIKPPSLEAALFKVRSPASVQ